MNKTIEAYLPGETQLTPKKHDSPIEEMLDVLRAHVDAGGTFNHRNGLDLLKACEFLFKDRNDCREDARNRADRLDQIRRLA